MGKSVAQVQHRSTDECKHIYGGDESSHRVMCTR
jgi:hypothetical protein